jgi:hypothetical protein
VHPRALNGSAAYDARGALSDSQFHLLLPATKLNVCPGRPNLSIGPVWPVAPDRCAGYLDYFFGADADAEWIAAFTGSSSRRHGPTTRRGPGRATLRA